MTRPPGRHLHRAALLLGRTRLGFAAATVTILAVACGTGVPSAAEGRTTLAVAAPTPTVNLPFPAPTSSAGQAAPAPITDDGEVATTEPIPTPAEEGTPTPLAVPETSATATSVPAPTAAVDPEPTATPQPTATPRATATARATMTPTATPTGGETPTEVPESTETDSPDPDEASISDPTATSVAIVSGGIAQVGISCRVSPAGVVDVGEQVRAQAVQQNRADVAYVFDFDDGTTASGESVATSYGEPGNYVVTLGWRLADEVGVVECGTVRVVLEQELAESVADFVGLSESQAETLAAERTLTLWVARRDLVLFSGNEDFRFDRVNIELDQGFVVSAWVG